MSTEIAVSVITLIGTILTVYGGNKLTAYRIEQLEKRVNKHNNLIERTFKIEERLTVDEEQIKVANHRIDDLEKEN
nr:MAG TPA: hemolysin [Caudoviricetes sp.]